MAQLIGFTPYQAYQMLMYSEATDQSQYTPFDQNGVPMISSADLSNCVATWGTTAMRRYCEAATPVVNGLSRFNDATGGMLLHLYTRYASNGAPPPPVNGRAAAQTFPADYFSAVNAPHELVVNNLRDWVFDQRADACVGGILARGTGRADNGPCASSSHVLQEPQNYFAPGFYRLTVQYQSTLGQLIINTDSSGATVVATNPSLGRYIWPEDVTYAKMGILVHSLEDRYSHHHCSDNSYFYQTADGDWTSVYSSVECAQGSHFLWHTWEQGTDQSSANLAPEFQTMQPALAAAFDQLVAYAGHTGTKVNRVNVAKKAAIVNSLIQVLQIAEPQPRLSAMVALMEGYQVLPLPGHGSVASLTH
jgi:hypothetical protein